MRHAPFLLVACVLVACSSDEISGEPGEGDASVEDITLADTTITEDRADVSAEDARDDFDADVHEASDLGTDFGAESVDTADAHDGPVASCESAVFWTDCTPGAVCDCPPCEAGTLCVVGPTGGGGTLAFCATVPPECDGTFTCDCMGCLCGLDFLGGPCLTVNDVGMSCRGTTSRREKKREIRYVDDEEREVMAKQALAIPLASYAYKTDPPDARRRLGFLIDDQPDPSFAVDGDRTHVDLYGYTSMLLATVQQQQKEIAALERRVDALEKKH